MLASRLGDSRTRMLARVVSRHCSRWSRNTSDVLSGLVALGAELNGGLAAGELDACCVLTVAVGDWLAVVEQAAMTSPHRMSVAIWVTLETYSSRTAASLRCGATPARHTVFAERSL